MMLLLTEENNMLKNLITKLEGKKTYGSIVLAGLACLGLWLSGADTQSIVLAAAMGLLGGTAGMRDALKKDGIKRDDLGAQLLSLLGGEEEDKS